MLALSHVNERMAPHLYPAFTLFLAFFFCFALPLNRIYNCARMKETIFGANTVHDQSRLYLHKSLHIRLLISEFFFFFHLIYYSFVLSSS